MSPAEISRREFIAHTTTVGVFASLGIVWRARIDVASVIRIGVIGYSRTSSAPRDLGLTLGVEEGNHAASMFGGGLVLVDLASRARDRAPVHAIVGDAGCSECQAIMASSRSAGVPFMNTGSTADVYRSAQCARTMFHVAPSDAMRADALRVAGKTGTVDAWLPSLIRFGADTLNRRFRERFKEDMTSDAWTAWFAVKALWETSLRVRSTSVKRLVEALADDATHFDGHKGLPLSFRSWDHQLRQPLYVTGEGRMTEVPSANPELTARVLLDSLGTAESSSQCRFQ